MTEPLRISPNYTVEDWKSLTFSTEKEWQKAVDIFEDRIRGRFLDIVAALEKYAYAGFAVLALDCLLIETLQQFREGKAQTPKKKSGDYFVSFLTETSFREFFTRKTAGMFYDQIRNGILHQAEVKETSRVLIRKGVPMVSTAKDGNGLVINRKLFHKQLVKVFEEYISDLRNPLNGEARSKFRRKMNYICRMTPGE